MRRIMILFILLLVSLPIAAGLASEPPQGTSRRLEWDKVYYANVPNESNPSNIYGRYNDECPAIP